MDGWMTGIVGDGMVQQSRSCIWQFGKVWREEKGEKGHFGQSKKETESEEKLKRKVEKRQSKVFILPKKGHGWCPGKFRRWNRRKPRCRTATDRTSRRTGRTRSEICTERSAKDIKWRNRWARMDMWHTDGTAGPNTQPTLLCSSSPSSSAGFSSYTPRVGL